MLHIDKVHPSPRLSFLQSRDVYILRRLPATGYASRDAGALTGLLLLEVSLDIEKELRIFGKALASRRANQGRSVAETGITSCTRPRRSRAVALGACGTERGCCCLVTCQAPCQRCSERHRQLYLFHYSWRAQIVCSRWHAGAGMRAQSTCRRSNPVKARSCRLGGQRLTVSARSCVPARKERTLNTVQDAITDKSTDSSLSIHKLLSSASVVAKKRCLPSTSSRRKGAKPVLSCPSKRAILLTSAT